MKTFILIAALFGFTAANAGENHPCAAVKAACEAAGFIKSGHKEKKGLYIDCLRPIMHGSTVPGVTVSAADIDACKAKKGADHH